MLNSIVDRHAPLRLISKQENRLSDKSWITLGILTYIKTKNKLFKIYFKNFKNKNFDINKFKKEHYKTYLKKLTHVKNLAKRNYDKNLVKCNNNNRSQTLLKKSLFIKILLKKLYYHLQ